MKKQIYLIVLTFITNMKINAQCNTDDYTALRALYLSTNGDNWKNNNGWDVKSEIPTSDCNLAKFAGVYLVNGRVNTISLGQNNLTGELPKELALLTEVKNFWLNQNSISGKIPKELGSLQKMESLALSFNKFTGSIPIELFSLNAITNISLESNLIEGQIPTEIGKLINLKRFDFSFNNLTGKIPEEIFSLPSIEEIILNDNQFEGELPQKLGDLLNLKKINLSQNQLKGCIPLIFKKLCSIEINLDKNLALADWRKFCSDGSCIINGVDASNQISTGLCDIDKSKMIPLRNAVYRKYQYVVKLKGKAINLDNPYEIHFDTGSWTTSIPGGALNFDNIKIIEKNVKDPWGNLADMVSGQLILESLDGTPYELNDYVFYATKDKNTLEYLPDDRQSAYANGQNSILGAFPSIDPVTKLPSVPFAIASKYASNNLGLGIVSDCYDDITTDWNKMKSYLQIGIDPTISNKLNFRNDIPNWRNQAEFHPEAVPGFKISIKFSDTNKIIETNNNLIATVDTGAPDLTLRLGETNPQDKEPFTSHFVKEGSWLGWNNSEYINHAKTLIDAEVIVEFKDSQGISNSWSFPVGKNPYASPNILYSGQWNGGVPYTLITPSGPPNRINLGNTIYFYCPVYYWDIKNKRVGIGFRNQQKPDIESSVLGLESSLSEEILIYPNPSLGSFTVKTTDLIIDSVFIYDSMGRKIDSDIKKEGNLFVINCNYKGSGFLNIVTNRGTCFKKILFE